MLVRPDHYQVWVRSAEMSLTSAFYHPTSCSYQPMLTGCGATIAMSLRVWVFPGRYQSRHQQSLTEYQVSLSCRAQQLGYRSLFLQLMPAIHSLIKPQPPASFVLLCSNSNMSVLFSMSTYYAAVSIVLDGVCTSSPPVSFFWFG